MDKNIVISSSSRDVSESLPEITKMYLKQECLQRNKQVSQLSNSTIIYNLPNILSHVTLVAKTFRSDEFRLSVSNFI